MTIRLGRMVTYLERLLLIELLNTQVGDLETKLYLASVELILISHIYFLIIHVSLVLQFPIAFV